MPDSSRNKGSWTTPWFDLYPPVKPIIIHRAPWLVTVAGAGPAAGAVAVAGGRILAVGEFTELRSGYPGAGVRDHHNCALVPPLVNAHIHLELSHLAQPGPNPVPESFTAWVAGLLARREQLGATGENVAAAARQTLDQQHRSGVIALADIGNTDTAAKLAGAGPLVLHFREFLGLTRNAARENLAVLAGEPEMNRCTAHAPYSTHADLITGLKRRARQLGHLFPLHVAESAAENELVSSGSGELKDFLRQRGFWDDSFQPTGIDNSGSVRYLHQLGILDERTLCVHCVHVGREEAGLLAADKAKVCLCPGSNRFLGVGRAPVDLFLQHGILPALGTDSLASNRKLSMWREMRLLQEDHPGLDPAAILAMATLGGATALGIEQDYGTLEHGKSADFLAVPLPGGIRTPGQLLDYLVTGGTTIQPVWI